MNKIILVTIITLLLLLSGCSKDGSTNLSQQNKQEPSVPSINTAPNSSAKTTPPTSTTARETFDYSQYIKKTWMKKESLLEKVYFSILKIENGKISGKFSVESYDQKDQKLPYFGSDFEGTINKDIAECQYYDSQPPEGTFEFAPENLKDIKYFQPIESQSFHVNLNSWGNVTFVSGTLETGNHVPTVFYLTNENGDILYDFINVENFPYSVDVKAVSLQDVNKDGLKDIIIIVADNYNGSGEHIANVYFQKTDGSFTNDYKLNEDINHSGNNQDVTMITNYLSQKFQ
ncbi:hypothetical protein [Niallia oryzisoli]|uniref:hypothetical protein n=1 Tax=Niallia oryzisoli TaxID=1737571 RepID=UPI00373538A7